MWATTVVCYASNPLPLKKMIIFLIHNFLIHYPFFLSNWNIFSSSFSFNKVITPNVCRPIISCRKKYNKMGVFNHVEFRECTFFNVFLYSILEFTFLYFIFWNRSWILWILWNYFYNFNHIFNTRISSRTVIYFYIFSLSHFFLFFFWGGGGVKKQLKFRMGKV